MVLKIQVEKYILLIMMTNDYDMYIKKKFGNMILNDYSAVHKITSYYFQQ